MKKLNQYFDSTLLKPEATKAQIAALCREASRYDFAAVCVNPCYIALAKEVLNEEAHSDIRYVKIATVIGFPLGAMTTAAKAAETMDAVANGADEIDMVMNIGMFKSGDFTYVLNDITEIVGACDALSSKYLHIPVKVILETCLLSPEEITHACRLAKTAGAAYVKTSTGFNSGGATVEAIQIMRDAVGNTLKIKAAGGIRDLDAAMKMIDAGADRIGCSACGAIMAEYESMHLGSQCSH